MEAYDTVLEHSSFEYEDKKSIFIGEAAPVTDESEAISFIESVKKRYPDATHHVYAYVLRANSTARFTDDREPQGTAGMPVLDSIRKNGIVDAVVVVTRYFGRSGKLTFKELPIDASRVLSDESSSKLEPFDMQHLKPFQHQTFRLID